MKNFFNEVNWDILLEKKVIITSSVIIIVIIAILIAIFVFQCYHRNCFQKFKELFSPDYYTNQIHLLSYNICLRAPLITNNGDDFKNLRLNLFIQNVIEHFDIIFLQDVIGAYSARRPHLIECAEEKGFHYSLVSLTPILPCFICDGGLMILSKFPLKNRDQYVFNSKLYPDSLYSRGVLYAQISPNENTVINVFNTRLLPPSDNPLSKSIRRKQIDELVKYIMKKTDDNNYPIILCGDFTINALEKAETVYNESFWESEEDEEDEEIQLKESIKYVEEQSDEYISLVNKLSNIGTVNNVLYNGLRRHPITTGDTYFDNGKEKPLEVILTDVKEQMSKKCEDFIFYITKKDELNIVAPYVHSYDVDDDNIQFLSSHYGLSCVINC